MQYLVLFLETKVHTHLEQLHKLHNTIKNQIFFFQKFFDVITPSCVYKQVPSDYTDVEECRKKVDDWINLPNRNDLERRRWG